MTLAPRICSALLTILVLAIVSSSQLAAQTPAAPPVTNQTPADSRQLQQLEPLKTLPANGKRWALVVGVDKYTDPQISPLRGAANDARVLADTLVRYAGFPSDQVILLATDQPTERQPTRVNLLRRLSNLAAAVPKDGLLLLSFSGHGMERGGQAFLLPSDAQISDQISFLEDTAINVSRMRELIRGTGVAQVMVLLDACRNDPGGRADAPNNMTQAYVNGFNFDVRNREVQAFATIYATGVGQRAYEYTEKKQGYFTWAIVEALKGGGANPNGEVTLSELVKYVQDTVPKRIAIDLGSGKQQRPFATIEGYKAEELVLSAPGARASSEAASVPSGNFVDPTAIELSFWDAIKNSSSPDDFKAYLDKYPEGQFASLAKLRAQPSRGASPANDSSSFDMSYWNAIKDSKNPTDFKAYQTKFPNGFFADLAASRLSALENEEREREKARLVAETLNVEDSTWMGSVFSGKPEEKRDVKIEFLKGGVFNATYQMLTTVPGILINSYKWETIKLSGTWRQTNDLVSVQLSQPTGEGVKLTVGETKMQGASEQGNYKFSVQKILKKALSTNGQNPGACDFHGFKVVIRYRKKDKIDRAAEATKLAERLKGLGAEVEVEQRNWKDAGTSLNYFNDQAEIAKAMTECLKEVMPLRAEAGGVSTDANVLVLWLQL